MSATIRDATVVFGAVYGALLVPIQRRIAQYLQHNCYTLLIGDATLVPLRGTTSRALHDEIMAIGAPFHLVLMDLGKGDISWRAANTSCCALSMRRRLRILGPSFSMDVPRSHPSIPQG